MSGEKSLLILEQGDWKPAQIAVHQIAPREVVSLLPDDLQAIEENWQKILVKNPKAFAGPTIRLVGRHHLKDKLVLEVVPSDYKEGCLLSFLGVAMVPMTSDGFIALQCPVASVAATVGAGIRTPGCTPTDTNIFIDVCREMKEEFAVDINESNMTVLGLMDISPPIAKPHHALVIKVKLAQTSQELSACWQTAEYKWEGELKFLDINGGQVLLGGLGDKEFNRQSLLAAAMVVDSEFGSDYIYQWSRSTGYW